MVSYINDFFLNIMDYVHAIFDIPIFQYLLSFIVVVMVLGLLGRLLKVNN